MNFFEIFKFKIKEIRKGVKNKKKQVKVINMKFKKWFRNLLEGFQSRKNPNMNFSQVTKIGST